MNGVEGAVRRASCAVLEFSTRISPEEVRPWGEALLGELGEIRSSLESFSWALGGTLLLLRETLTWALLGGAAARLRRAMRSEPFMQQEEIMKRLFTWMGPLLFLCALAFFLSPVFRQGAALSMRGWTAIADRTIPSHAELMKLALAARREHDAQTLAFVALRVTDPQEHMSLSQEAVAMDPSLTWIYSQGYVPWMMGITQKMVADLRRAYPQNAMVHGLEAQHIAAHEALRKVTYYQSDVWEQQPEWLAAMAMAYASPRFDDFSEQRFNLDRAVMREHGIDDPVVLSTAAWQCCFSFQPYLSYAFVLSDRAQKSLARGDRSSAMADYWQMDRFGRMFRESSRNEYGRVLGASILIMADQALVPLLRAQGETHEAAAMESELAHLGDYQSRAEQHDDRQLDIHQQKWSGSAVQASFQIFALAMLVAVFCWGRSLLTVFRSRTASPHSSLMGTLASIVAAFAGAAMYLLYRPLSYTYQYYMSAPNPGDLWPLRVFILFMEPMGWRGFTPSWVLSAFALAVPMFVLSAMAVWILRRFHRQTAAVS